METAVSAWGFERIRALILIREGDENFAASNYAEYRWQNKESFSPTAFYVFGDYLALISFHSEMRWRAAKAIKCRLVHAYTDT